MLGLGLSLQKGVSAFNAGRALVSSYIRRVTSDGGVLQNTACDAAAINELNQDRLLEPASWVLVPDGIKEDVVYAQKPSSGLGDLVMTRASDATYTDSTGVVRRSPYNLLQQSEMFSNAVWTKVNSTIGIDATVAPNGTLTADKLVATVINDQHRIDQTPTSLATTQTFSVYAKAGEYPAVGLRLGTTGAGFNLSTGVVFSTSSGITSSIQSVGNGWYRCSITKATGVSNDIARINISDGVTAASNFAGDGTSGVFIWGAQLVEGTSALDYFPTTNRQDVPRIDFRNADGTLSSCGRLLLEPQRTNSIRNSSMVGAVAGTPGTLPTNWTQGNAIGGFTRTVVGIGTENGLPYIDLRYNGTAINTFGDVLLESANIISSANAATWNESAYLRLIAAPNPPLSTRFGFRQFNSGVTFLGIATSTALPISSYLARYDRSFTTNQATVAFVQPSVFFDFTNGATYDFTIRIAAPQMELGGYATSWVPTTTAAVTRIADTFTRNNIFTNGLISSAGGTWFIEISDNASVLRDNGSGLFIGDTAFANNGNQIIIRSAAPAAAARFSIIRYISGTATTLHTTTTNKIKVAVKWNGSVMDVFVNGVKVSASNLFTTTTMQNMIAGAGQIFEIDQMLLAPTPLSDDQCEVLTSEGYGNYALLAQSLNCVLQ